MITVLRLMLVVTRLVRLLRGEPDVGPFEDFINSLEEDAAP